MEPITARTNPMVIAFVFPDRDSRFFCLVLAGVSIPSDMNVHLGANQAYSQIYYASLHIIFELRYTIRRETVLLLHAI